MNKYFVILLLFFANQGIAQTSQELFKQANESYANQNYQKAIEDYHHILDKGEHSANLYFNLANSYYKTNQVAPAIFYYEKALQLDPSDSEIKNNLSFANKMKIDKIELIPQTGLGRFFDKVALFVGLNFWTYLSLFTAFASCVLFGFYYFSSTPSIKRTYFLGAIGILSILVFSLVFAFRTQHLREYRHFAIIFEEEIPIKSEPNPKSSEIFKLHAGTKVKLLDTFNGFNKIELSDGRIGWINNKAIKKL